LVPLVKKHGCDNEYWVLPQFPCCRFATRPDQPEAANLTTFDLALRALVTKSTAVVAGNRVGLPIPV
jgi:hypothetical protein